ncbi:hypothetical protein TWF506_005720 [Arthrobotrys conoides]|uniref:Uncharacterized protein n=1 Tax=Arthrobotrys conoides TaxID=74498 RepID=A0AAN8NCK2_9PEZI
MDPETPIQSVSGAVTELRDSACQVQDGESNLQEGQILCICRGDVCKSIDQGSWKLADRTRNAFDPDRPELFYPISIERCSYFSNPAAIVELPEPLEKILSYENPEKTILHRYGIFRIVRYCWSFRNQDSPLASVYRMYEFLVADLWKEICYESDYFWYSLSPVEGIPAPPANLDSKTYACIASMIQTLVKAYNYKIGLGIPRYKPKGMTTLQCSRLPKVLERVPDWAVSYPPLSGEDAMGIRSMFLNKRNGEDVTDFDPENGPFIYFSKRNLPKFPNIGCLWTI